MKTAPTTGLLTLFLAGCGSSAQHTPGPQAPGLKALARDLLEQGLGEGDIAFINEHVAVDYIQHNPTARDGRAGLLEVAAFLEEQGFTIDIQRVFAEGDLVALHSVVTLGEQRLAVFDLFRFDEAGRFVEHWDGLQPWVEPTASGRTMIDGPTAATDLDKTAANKQLVTAFITNVFMTGQLERVPTYLADEYRQHNPQIPDGRDALVAFFASLAGQGVSFSYAKLHRVVAEGNFVVTLSEGEIGGQTQAFYDLWRVEGDKIVEHWDVVQAVPEEMAHTNGMF